MTLQEIIPLPKLEQCKRLLCVQPHPDDNEIGAGATIAKLVHNGCEVVYLTVTDGRIGSNDPKIHPRQLAAIRRKETEASARLLGVSASFFLDFQDGSFISEQAVCRKITDVIREVQPEMVMTVDPFLPYETHYDHRTVGMATAGACMMASLPHFQGSQGDLPANSWSVAGVAFYNTAYPNTYINVDETWNLKFTAIAAHKSQFDEEYLKKVRMYFELKGEEYAKGRGFDRAEAFKVLPVTCLHVNVDAINL